MEESNKKLIIDASSDPDPLPPPYYIVQPQPYFQPQYLPQHQLQPSGVNNLTHEAVEVSSYMGIAIFSCMCCFWPLGWAAVRFAMQSKDAFSRGDVSTAQARGKAALVLSLISIGLGVIGLIVIAIAEVTSHSSDDSF